MLDGIHHIHHILPIAMELSQDHNFQCVVFAQSESLPIIHNIAKLYPNHRCSFEVLSSSLMVRMKYRIKHKPLGSQRIIKSHIDKFLQFDSIISPNSDMDLLITKSQYLTKKPFFFCTQHGAGDRPINIFSDMHMMDLAMFMGEKYVERFIEADSIEAKKCVIIGYPKFDIIPKDYKARLFGNDKPVIMYNPHFVEQSSWWQWGLEILEYFHNQNQYNLIFSPHIILFNRFLKPRDLPKKYFTAPHILLDFGSEKLVNMTYTQSADVYLGDVSSQVYEFIRTPRPCIFLNAANIDWRNHSNTLYSGWAMGPVITELPQLWEKLRSYPVPNPYLVIQEQLFKRTYSLTNESAGVRAANAIREFLKVEAKSMTLTS